MQMEQMEPLTYEENLYDDWIVGEEWIVGEVYEVGKEICLNHITIEWFGLGMMVVVVEVLLIL